MALDGKFLMGVCGVFVALAAYALSKRREKRDSLPVMTGYGDDFERAMIEGTMRVSLLIPPLPGFSWSYFILVPYKPFRSTHAASFRHRPKMHFRGARTHFTNQGHILGRPKTRNVR